MEAARHWIGDDAPLSHSSQLIGYDTAYNKQAYNFHFKVVFDCLNPSFIVLRFPLYSISLHLLQCTCELFVRSVTPLTINIDISLLSCG